MYTSRIHEHVTMEEEGDLLWRLLASLAFVALAQCKHRHYSTLAAYLSLEIPSWMCVSSRNG